MKPIQTGLTAALLLLLPSLAHAQAVEFYKCHISDEGTMEAIIDATAAMLETAHENGHAEYTVSFLNPLYASDISRGVFYWVGSAPSYAAIGAFNDYWDSEENNEHRARWRALSSGCDSSSLYGVYRVGEE